MREHRELRESRREPTNDALVGDCKAEVVTGIRATQGWEGGLQLSRKREVFNQIPKVLKKSGTWHCDTHL